MLSKLGRAEDIEETVVVIQTPYSVRSSGLEHVVDLESPHGANIGCKAVKAKISQVVFGEDPDFEETQEEDEDIQFMTSAIVDASVIAK